MYESNREIQRTKNAETNKLKAKHLMLSEDYFTQTFEQVSYALKRELFYKCHSRMFLAGIS